ncbi:MAG: hypothetical protein Alpg2KO_10580 [Alphaproteobacteria bacterium]
MPANMIHGEGDYARLQNAFGHPVTLTPVQDNTRYRVTSHDLPMDTCKDLVTRFGTPDLHQALTGLSVTGPNQTSLPELPTHSPPISAVQASSICAFEDANTLSLFFR